MKYKCVDAFNKVINECRHEFVNPSNAEATFVQSTRTQRFLKIILTLSCWYSFDSTCWVLSDDYPHSRVLVIFQVFCISLYWLN